MPGLRLHMVRSLSWAGTATGKAVAVAVRHAQDAEFGDAASATVSVEYSSEPPGATDFTSYWRRWQQHGRSWRVLLSGEQDCAAVPAR